VFSVCRLVSRRCHGIDSIAYDSSDLRYHEGSDSWRASPRHTRSPYLLRFTFRPFNRQPQDGPGHRFDRHVSVTDGFQASPLRCRLAAPSRRIAFVLLQTGRSLPVASHPTSR
jgi:hypothetical protein